MSAFRVQWMCLVAGWTAVAAAGTVVQTARVRQRPVATYLRSMGQGKVSAEALRSALHDCNTDEFPAVCQTALRRVLEAALSEGGEDVRSKVRGHPTRLGGTLCSDRCQSTTATLKVTSPNRPFTSVRSTIQT